MRCWRRVQANFGGDDTSVDVERGLAGLGASLLLEVVEQLAQRDGAREEPQDDSAATYAHKIRTPKGRSTGRFRPRPFTTACADCSRGRWSQAGWTGSVT